MLIHAGSVKDILSAGPNELVFKFSDRYSIFDWGQMPDAIPGKGAALAKMGKKFFEELSHLDVKTHYLGAGASEDSFRVRKILVPRGKIGVYANKPTWTLIPLEIIFRFGVPKGSSLLKRSTEYFEGQEFAQPLMDYTTKLERMDRVLTPEEAKTLSGMTESEWGSLSSAVMRIAQYLCTRFEGLGLKMWDGKVEFAFGDFLPSGEREMVLVDSMGLDEMRLTFEGKPLSKEILRQFYIESDWYKNLARAKQEDPTHFKEKCINEYHSEPERLSPEILIAVGSLYQSVAEILSVSPADGESIRKTHAQIREALTQIEGARR